MEKERKLWGGRSRLVKNRTDGDDMTKPYGGAVETDKDSDERWERLENLISGLVDQYNSLAEKLDCVETSIKAEKEDGTEFGNGKLERLDSLLGGLSGKFDEFDERLQKIEPLLESMQKNESELYNDRLEHLDSLTRLAENTIIEADKLSQHIGSETERNAQNRANDIIAAAEERAKEEANYILANAEERAQDKVVKAEQQAQDILKAAEEQGERVKESAKEQAQDIVRQTKANAEEEAKVIKQDATDSLLRSKQMAEGELKEMFDQVYQKLLAKLNDVEKVGQDTAYKQTGEQEQVVFGHTVSETLNLAPYESITSLLSDQVDGNDSRSEIAHDEPEVLSAEGRQGQSPEAVTDNETFELQPDIDKREEPVEEGLQEHTLIASTDDEEFEPQVVTDKHEEPIVEDLMNQQFNAQAEESEFGQEACHHEQEEPLLGEESQIQPSDDNDKEEITLDPELFEGTVELAIPPPVPLDRMLQIHKSLKQVPCMEVLNLGGSVDKGITIRVLVDPSTRLIDVVKELPEVSEAREELPDDENLVPRRRGEESPIRRVLITTKE